MQHCYWTLGQKVQVLFCLQTMFRGNAIYVFVSVLRNRFLSFNLNSVRLAFGSTNEGILEVLLFLVCDCLGLGIVKDILSVPDFQIIPNILCSI